MWILLVAALASTTPDVESAADAVGTAFVRAVTTRDLDALSAMSSLQTRGRDWVQLVEQSETYDCVSVEKHTTEVRELTESSMTLVVTIDASATRSGPRRSAVRFPRRWYVDVAREEREWKIGSALIAERVIARRLVAAPTSASAIEAAAVAEDVDLAIVVEELAHEVFGTPSASRMAAIEVVRAYARDLGMATAEVVALRAASQHATAGKDLERAVAFASEACEVAAASGVADAIAIANLAAGTAEALAGHDDAAIARYSAAGAVLNDCNDVRPALKALYMRGLILLRRGVVREAFRSAAEVDRNAQLYGWTEGRCVVTFQRFEAYSTLRDWPAARLQAEASVPCAERLRNERFIQQALYNLALAERMNGNRAAALKLLRGTYERTAKSPGPRSVVLLDMAELHIEDQRHAEAEVLLVEALENVRRAQERRVQAEILDALARVRLHRGRPAEALSAAEEADALMRDVTGSMSIGMLTRDDTWRIRATLGIVLRANGRTDAAIETLQSSIDLIDTQREALGTDELSVSDYMEDKGQPYRELVSLLVDAGRLEEAVVVAERLRARALGSAVARGHVDRLPAMSDADQARHRSLNDAIAAANRKLLLGREDSGNDALRAELAQHRRELRDFLVDLYARRPDIRRRSFDDPRVATEPDRLLPRRDEVIVTYLVGEQESFGFLLERTDDGVEMRAHRIRVTRTELERRVSRFVSAVEGGSLEYGRDARALHDLLLGPFAARIARRRLLYVVPDGVLWRLPMQALQDARGKHLIERVALAYAPSLALLRSPREERTTREPATRLLALADPVLPGADRRASGEIHRDAVLVPLADARIEARRVAKFYPHNRVLIGADATEAAAKRFASDFDVLHLATHGIIDDAAPMHSALVLTATGDDDGLLEAREMIDLDLGADLAVLSACRSGGGGIAPGEGVIGMSWALMAAGCRNTVVSQWDVASVSTSKLMVAFHRELSRNDGGYAVALQKAQLAVMREEQFSHPFYWSPFVLISTSQ